MRYIIYKDGAEVNRIVADEDFCRTYYSSNGYSYERVAEPEPGPEPEPDPTTEEILSVLLGEVSEDEQ